LVYAALCSSSSLYFHAMSPLISLHSWTNRSNFFVVRKKSALSHRRVNANASLTSKRVFMYRIVPASHALALCDVAPQTNSQ
jgi:hypothetical protein